MIVKEKLFPDTNLYFKLFSGSKVLLSEIKQNNPMMEYTALQLVKWKGAGQYTLNGDLLLWLFDIPQRIK